MNGAFDLLTFVGVVLQGASLVAQSVLLGSAAFVLLVLAPLGGSPASPRCALSLP